ncbi:diguanylate cyclase (GGDEF)-like protein [Prauserella shujinwangii]|uniref:Diguanylate cyclase (GGDEF)-like protein n=1 Tax=Prauserella shujinwangii TaxID=1453103 RepID=A0A2T0LMT3_9PSEU|nr:diguanylate cyclase (GGDEF)-like protein [Prauserella shujinwangii]
MVGNGVRNGSNTRDCADLLAVHESIASMFAAQGEWQRAYEHLRSAFQIATASADPGPQVPEQYRREVEQLRRESAQARIDSLTDALTATFNRRYLDRRLLELRTPTIALVDLDLFKRVNDTYGHHAGDQVLRRVVALLRENLPPDAFCARYGGEEFVLVLPDAGLGTAVAIAERARARIAEHAWTEFGAGLSVTVSIGVAPRPESPCDPQDLLLEADSLLYAAKRAGRNLVAYRQSGTIRVVGTVRGASFDQARERGPLASLDRG